MCKTPTGREVEAEALRISGVVTKEIPEGAEYVLYLRIGGQGWAGSCISKEGRVAMAKGLREIADKLEQAVPKKP